MANASYRPAWVRLKISLLLFEGGKPPRKLFFLPPPPKCCLQPLRPQCGQEDSPPGSILRNGGQVSGYTMKFSTQISLVAYFTVWVVVNRDRNVSTGLVQLHKSCKCMLFSRQLEVRSHEIVIPLQSLWTEYTDEAIEKWSAVLQL